MIKIKFILLLSLFLCLLMGYILLMFGNLGTLMINEFGWSAWFIVEVICFAAMVIMLYYLTKMIKNG